MFAPAVSCEKVGDWGNRYARLLAIVLIFLLLLMGCSEQSHPETNSGSSGEVAVEPKSKETEAQEVKEAKGKESEERQPAFQSSQPPVTEPEGPRPTEIAGVAFTKQLIELLDYEVNGRFWGWRPNDLLIGRVTDNVVEFQLGALEAMRYTSIKLKENLTRFGDADAYDPHLIQAVNLLMNRADQFWFPSSESQYNEALKSLRTFLENLEQGKSRFYYRTDNLLSLITSYKDLLGNCYENLVKEREPDGSRVSYFQADNYFYYCQGVAHVMHGVLGTVCGGFVEQLQTIDAVALMDKIVNDLERATECKPWVITNSHDDDILANHRYHLAASIGSALVGMSTMLRY